MEMKLLLQHTEDLASINKSSSASTAITNFLKPNLSYGSITDKDGNVNRTVQIDFGLN
jgi:hypothetical protein